MHGSSPRQQNPDMEHVVGLSLQSVPTSVRPLITLILAHALSAYKHMQRKTSINVAHAQYINACTQLPTHVNM